MCGEMKVLPLASECPGQFFSNWAPQPTIDRPKNNSRISARALAAAQLLGGRESKRAQHIPLKDPARAIV